MAQNPRILDTDTLADDLIRRIRSGDRSPETFAEAIKLLHDAGHTLPKLRAEKSSDDPTRH
jgi:hypothetical protein